MAATPAGRETFAKSSVCLLKDLGLDGLDIDWEYPADSTQAHNLVLLLQRTRQELDAYAASTPGTNRLLLTVASPAGPPTYNLMHLKEMNHYLDFWNLMAYDFAGSWDSHAGHQANLFPSPHHKKSTPFNTEEAVNDYIKAGIAPSKIVMGMPLYGRAFENTEGPGHPYSGVGEGSWENGVWDYKALPLPGAIEHVDHHVGASWCYHEGARKMVTYDTLEMARFKTEWLKKKKLGGAMWWESSTDKVGEQSLIAAVAGLLGERGGPGLDRSLNTLEYPESKFDNLRKGFPGE